MIFAINPNFSLQAHAEEVRPSISPENGADKGSAAVIIDEMDDIRTNIDSVIKLTDDLKRQVKDIQDQLDQKQLLLKQSDAERKALSESLNIQIKYLDTFSKNWKEYEGNVHALNAELAAKKYLPWAYALAAVMMVKKDAWQDQAIIGLAGYGTGALIEQNDLGLGHFGVRALFKLGYSF